MKIDIYYKEARERRKKLTPEILAWWNWKTHGIGTPISLPALAEKYGLSYSGIILVKNRILKDEKRKTESTTTKQKTRKP